MVGERLVRAAVARAAGVDRSLLMRSAPSGVGSGPLGAAAVRVHGEAKVTDAALRGAAEALVGHA